MAQPSDPSDPTNDSPPGWCRESPRLPQRGPRRPTREAQALPGAAQARPRRTSPVLYSGSRGSVHPPLLLFPSLPLPPFHRAENLLGLALAQPTARLLRSGWRRRLRLPSGRRLPTAPSSSTTVVGRRRRLTALGQFEIPFSPSRRRLQPQCFAQAIGRLTQQLLGLRGIS